MSHQYIRDILEEAQEVVSSIDFNDEDFGFGALKDPEKTPRDSSVLPAMVGSTATSFPEKNDDDGFLCPPPEKKRTWKKPQDKPKRPLSAYNLFFQFQRERIVQGDQDKRISPEELRAVISAHRSKRGKRRHRKTHGKISFTDLARTIASAWKCLDPDLKAIFEECAAGEKVRYKRDVADWNSMQTKIQQMHMQLPKPVPSNDFAKAPPPPPSPIKSPVCTSPSTSQTTSSQTVFHTPHEISPVAKLVPVTPDKAPKIYQPQATRANPDSLQSLMSSGKSFMRYQALVEMQIESQLQQKQLEREAHELYMEYANHRGMPLHEGNQYGCNSMMHYNFMQPHAGRDDYVGAADRAFIMAQTTLPQSQTGPQPSMQMNHYRGRGKHENVDASHYFEPKPGVTSPGQDFGQDHAEDLMFEPHAGMLSPTFDQEDLANFMETFETTS